MPVFIDLALEHLDCLDLMFGFLSHQIHSFSTLTVDHGRGQYLLTFVRLAFENVHCQTYDLVATRRVEERSL